YTNYSANCSLSPGIPGNWTLNASQSYECLKPQDPGLQWPLWNPPDTVWPKTDACCEWFNVADYNDTVYKFRPYGFYNYPAVRVKVY
ncbi:MAG: hypothetical protein V1743_00965, partial [Nanoarchaeota archaeon]